MNSLYFDVSQYPRTSPDNAFSWYLQAEAQQGLFPNCLMDALCPARYVLHVMQLPHVRFAPGALNSPILWADILTSQLLSAILTLAFSLIIFFTNFQEKNHTIFVNSSTDRFPKFSCRYRACVAQLRRTVLAHWRHTQDSLKHVHNFLYWYQLDTQFFI